MEPHFVDTVKMAFRQAGIGFSAAQRTCTNLLRLVELCLTAPIGRILDRAVPLPIHSTCYNIALHVLLRWHGLRSMPLLRPRARVRSHISIRIRINVNHVPWSMHTFICVTSWCSEVVRISVAVTILPVTILPRGNETMRRRTVAIAVGTSVSDAQSLVLPPTSCSQHGSSCSPQF